MQRRVLLASLLAVLFAASAAGAAEPAAPSGSVTIAAVGDIMLGHRAGPYLRRNGPAYPFVHVLPVLREAEVVIGNLECPVSTRGTAVENKKFTLRAGPLAVDALKAAGVRVVTLANNHAMDFGPLALRDTLDALGENGILATGAGMDLAEARAPAILTVDGIRIAFLAYSLTFPLEFYASPGRPGTAPGYEEYVRSDIRKARARADLVVVSFHWGAELMTEAKDYQRNLGHKAIDWGADLVLGHHPHVLQQLEVYRGRLIAYSLGNFVFGSESDRTNTSIILLCTFKGKTLVRAEAVPLDVNNYRVAYQPRVLTGARADDLLERLGGASAKLGTRLVLRNDRAFVELTAPKAGRLIATAPGN